MEAARILISLARDARAEHVKLAAASRILDAATRLRDQLDVEERLAALEARLDERERAVLPS